MSTMLIVTILSSLFGLAYAKDWFGAGSLTDIQRMIGRMILATAGFMCLHLEEIVRGESSFFESVFTVIGVYCGVISSYVVMEKLALKQKPVFADDISVLGGILKHSVGMNACRWLYIGEVFLYLLIVLL